MMNDDVRGTVFTADEISAMRPGGGRKHLKRRVMRTLGRGTLGAKLTTMMDELNRRRNRVRGFYQEPAVLF